MPLQNNEKIPNQSVKEDLMTKVNDLSQTGEFLYLREGRLKTDLEAALQSEMTRIRSLIDQLTEGQSLLERMTVKNVTTDDELQTKIVQQINFFQILFESLQKISGDQSNSVTQKLANLNDLFFISDFFQNILKALQSEYQTMAESKESLLFKLEEAERHLKLFELKSYIQTADSNEGVNLTFLTKIHDLLSFCSPGLEQYDGDSREMIGAAILLFNEYLGKVLTQTAPQLPAEHNPLVKKLSAIEADTSQKPKTADIDFRTEGKKPGRPKANVSLQEIQTAQKEGLTTADIASKFKVSPQTIRNITIADMKKRKEKRSQKMKATIAKTKAEGKNWGRPKSTTENQNEPTASSVQEVRPKENLIYYLQGLHRLDGEVVRRAFAKIAEKKSITDIQNDLKKSHYFGKKQAVDVVQGKNVDKLVTKQINVLNYYFRKELAWLEQKE